jgi:hypothetical protein
MQEWQEQIEERLKKVEQQQTEPIQVTIERRYPDKELLQDILRKQDGLDRKLDEHNKILISHSRNISTLQTDVTTLTNEMKEVRADIANIQATQSDHSEILKTVATKQDLVAMETRLIETVKQLLQNGNNNE